MELSKILQAVQGLSNEERNKVAEECRRLNLATTSKVKMGQVVKVPIKDAVVHGIVVGGGKTLKVWTPSCDRYRAWVIEWSRVIEVLPEFYAVDRSKIPTDLTIAAMVKKYGHEGVVNPSNLKPQFPENVLDCLTEAPKSGKAVTA